MDPRGKAYVQQLIYLALAVGAEEISASNEANKEYPLMVSTNAAKLVRGNRLNIVFHEEMQTRATFLSPWFTMKAVDKEIQELLCLALPMEPSPDVVIKNLRMLTRVKQLCRNELAAKYVKEKKKITLGNLRRYRYSLWNYSTNSRRQN